MVDCRVTEKHRLQLSWLSIKCLLTRTACAGADAAFIRSTCLVRTMAIKIFSWLGCDSIALSGKTQEVMWPSWWPWNNWSPWLHITILLSLPYSALGNIELLLPVCTEYQPEPCGWPYKMEDGSFPFTTNWRFRYYLHTIRLDIVVWGGNGFL